MRHRIPPLRVAFTDQRGTGSGAQLHELLTEEIPVQIASVLSDEPLASALRSARGSLEPLVERSRRRGLWLIGIAALSVMGLFLFRRLRAAARLRRRKTAYDKATARLVALERRGIPDADEADDWYVELSDIVRRYLEDRFVLRAPELTTEEFLNEAKRSPELSGPHREMLSSFLAQCDQVKFAGYRPGTVESKRALAEARAFVEETRLSADAEARPALTTTAAESTPG